MYKILRRGSGRMLALCAILVSLLLCLYYVNQSQSGPGSGAGAGPPGGGGGGGGGMVDRIIAEPGVFERVFTSVMPQASDYSEPPDAQVTPDTCPLILPRDADIKAQEEFEKFDFQCCCVSQCGFTYL